MDVLPMTDVLIIDDIIVNSFCSYENENIDRQIRKGTNAVKRKSKYLGKKFQVSSNQSVFLAAPKSHF